MMKTVLLVLCLASLASSQMIAQAIIKGTSFDQNITGKVVFSQLPGQNVTITVTLSGITRNPDARHGLHVHFWGDLSDSTGSVSTGPHWATPGHTTHACPDGDNSTIRHNGDMGNWLVVAGVINQTKTLDLLTLSGLESIIGRAVVLHEAVDDCTTQPNGASSNRIAHGVIGIVNSTVYGGNAFASSGSNNTYAQVHLEHAAGTGNVYGTVWFTQLAEGVLVNAQIFGITGPHGFHLHWWGDISQQNGLATGAHFNPRGSMHGVPDNAVRHLGDMGVIYYYNNSVAYYTYLNSYLTLNGAESIIGRAVHVHENADDCVNPIGNGGARWAQGVVGLTVPHDAAFLQALFAGVPTTQNGTAICAALTSAPASSASTVATTAATSAATTVVVGTSAGINMTASSAVRASSRASTTAGDSPASIISMAWAVLVVAFAFCF